MLFAKSLNQASGDTEVAMCTQRKIFFKDLAFTLASSKYTEQTQKFGEPEISECDR